MRFFRAITGLGWDVPRFGKQLGRLALGLAGLCLLGFGAFVFSLYFNWAFIGTPVETFAVAKALKVSDTYTFCPVAEGHSINDPDCYVPVPMDFRHCRWWILESCRAFKMPDFILNDPVRLGTMLNAMIHPCPYLLTSSHSELDGSGLEKTCQTADTEVRHGPIVIEFSGKKKIIIRID